MVAVFVVFEGDFVEHAAFGAFAWDACSFASEVGCEEDAAFGGGFERSLVE
jgi:hypothetical protein